VIKYFGEKTLEFVNIVMGHAIVLWVIFPTSSFLEYSLATYYPIGIVVLFRSCDRNPVIRGAFCTQFFLGLLQCQDVFCYIDTGCI